MQEQALNPAPITIAEPPAIYQRASDPKLLKRIQILMWVTLAGMILSIPAVMIVPIWPDLAPISSGWVLLTYSSFFVLSALIDKALLLPLPNGKMPNWWLRIGATRLRPNVNFLLGANSPVIVLGAMFIFDYWLGIFKDWAYARYGLGSLIGGVIIYAILVIVWTHPDSKIDRFFSKSLGKGLIYTILVLGLISGFWIVLSGFRY